MKAMIIGLLGFIGFTTIHTSFAYTSNNETLNYTAHATLETFDQEHFWGNRRKAVTFNISNQPFKLVIECLPYSGRIALTGLNYVGYNHIYGGKAIPADQCDALVDRIIDGKSSIEYRWTMKRSNCDIFDYEGSSCILQSSYTIY